MYEPPPGAAAPDLYQLLGISRAASQADIGRAYRQQARAVHPDSRPREADAPARFLALAEAYQVLSDPGRRADYDRALPRRAAADRQRAPRPARAATAQVPAPALWVGPVQVDPPAAPPGGGGPGSPGSPGSLDSRRQDARLAAQALLLAVCLGYYPGPPW
jgi:curved DNA-binding protein CbpA